MANKHLIGKQVLQMEIGPSENAYALQQRFSEMIWKELSPRLSDLFDRFAGEDEVLRLDKIELDLGEINFDTSNNDAIIKKIIQKKKLILAAFHLKLRAQSFGVIVHGNIMNPEHIIPLTQDLE